ncbi:MAG: hypothetical protein JKY87_00205 [Mariprofundus sp.]|nr:hypothetical protein [Mariprofundus sp.]
MKITCPSCGAGGSIGLFIADLDARKAILAAAKLPSDCGPLVLKYIGFFSPQTRFLTTSRATSLIVECSDMIIDGVNFDRDFIKAPSYVWACAFRAMDSADISRPLKNHHYLLRIIQSELGKKQDSVASIGSEQRGSASMEPRIHNADMQRIGDVIAPAAPDALDALNVEAREKIMLQAKKSLLDEGFQPQWLAMPLIEQKAREMLEASTGSPTKEHPALAASEGKHG